MVQAACYLLYTSHLQSCLGPRYADRIDFLQPASCRCLVCRCTDSIMAANHCIRGYNENCNSALKLRVEVASAIYFSVSLSFIPPIPVSFPSLSIGLGVHCILTSLAYSFIYLFIYFAKSENGFSDVVVIYCSLTTFHTSLAWKQCDTDCFDIPVTSEEQWTRMLGLYRYAEASSHFLVDLLALFYKINESYVHTSLLVCPVKNEMK